MAMCSAPTCGCAPTRHRPQIAISMLSALNYYESTGQNWERAAMIKARPCAGDLVRPATRS